MRLRWMVSMMVEMMAIISEFDVIGGHDEVECVCPGEVKEIRRF